MAGACLRQFVACLVVVFTLFMSTDKATPSQLSESNAEAAKECVILLHGMGRTRWSMQAVAKSLEQQYRVYNKSYPSRKHTIENLAKLAIEPALDACQDTQRIHFVTHSLGGILVRQYLSEHHITALGNVVMLGPPNQGSELVDAFQRSPFLNAIYATLNGPAGQQLSTQANSKPLTLGPVEFNLGVIAGNKNRNPIFKRIMPGASDGKVTVERTKVEGMSHHLELDVDHTWMMTNKEVQEQIRYFIAHGEFSKS